jgi:hypothetical protein
MSALVFMRRPVCVPLLPDADNRRINAFNALNHLSFQAPSFEDNMLLTNAPSEFGVIPGTITPNGSDLSARVLQGSLRLEFYSPLPDIFGPAKIKPKRPPGSISARGVLCFLRRFGDLEQGLNSSLAYRELCRPPRIDMIALLYGTGARPGKHPDSAGSTFSWMAEA